jgi:hypothetical protein
MATAVTAIFGANSAPFQAELAKMESMTLASARRIATTSASGHAMGMSTMIREGITIPREVLEGRGMGRIIASMSIFVSALAAYSSGAHKAASYTSQLADGYERLALNAQIAAVAAERKAVAAGEDVSAMGFEDAATREAAIADAAKADAAKAAAIAAEEKAIAARSAADAEEMEAVAAGEATAASIPLLAIFIGVIAALALLYGAYKLVTGILHTFTEEKIKAAELSRALTLNFQEEAAALEKLANAADKAQDAIRRMNMSHDDYAKRVEVALQAQKDLYEHTKKLADLQKDSKLIQVDIDEKNGVISQAEAIKKKAAIEKQANIDAAKAKTDALWNEKEMLYVADQRASAAAKQKQAAAQAAADAINKSPEGIANAQELDRLEKIEKHTRKRADEEADAAAKLPEGREKNTHEVQANTLNAIADFAAQRVRDQKEKMQPAEIAATEAMQKAQEATENAKSVSEKHSSAVAEWLNQDRNSPSEVAAENAKIDLKSKEELLNGTKGGDARGYGLNSQQKIGAYAATAPILVQQLHELRGIRANTAPHSAPSNHPPGEKKPQLGAKPSSKSWVDYGNGIQVFR